MKESEDNLENFFRNRAESNQYGFEEGDWAKMEAKLDEEMPVVSAFSYSNLKWMTLGSVITAILIFEYNEFTTPAEESIPTEQVTENINNLLESASIVETELSVIGKSAEASINKLGIAKTPTQSNVTKLNEAGVDKTNLSANKELNTFNQILKNSENNQRIAKPAGLLVTEEDKNTAVEKKNFGSLNRNSKQIREAEVQKVGYSFNKYSLYIGDLKTYKLEPKSISPKRFYTLSLVGGMDITSTKASEWGTPTFRFGLNGEYFVGKRWSIGIGANLSKKKYQAKGKEYSPPKGFWTNGTVPDSTNAVCQVLDIPISVSYFQPINNKSNLIISGGLSSWFMLKEDYWYKYKSNDPNLVSWWGGENENRYWFSVVNIGVSYEYTLSNNWSVAAGPYINIPLSGVGHGNVALQSFGLKGALRFNKFKFKL